MALVLAFPSNKIFRKPEDRINEQEEREIFDADEDIPKEDIKPDKFLLIRHKKTKVVHHVDSLNDDYLYCGHLMWPDYSNFEKYFGDEDEVTCKKCMFNGPAFPGWWRAL